MLWLHKLQNVSHWCVKKRCLSRVCASLHVLNCDCRDRKCSSPAVIFLSFIIHLSMQPWTHSAYEQVFLLLPYELSIKSVAPSVYLRQGFSSSSPLHPSHSLWFAPVPLTQTPSILSLCNYVNVMFVFIGSSGSCSVPAGKHQSGCRRLGT